MVARVDGSLFAAVKSLLVGGLEKSPLNEYSSEIYDEEESAAEQLKAEEAVAVCMKEQGFEYIPFVVPSSSENDYDPGDEKWITQYGYGVFGYEPGAYGAEEVDPNDEYREGLSASERSAYTGALDGVSETQRGCHDAERFRPERADDFADAYAVLSAKITKSQKPIRIEVDEEWASCMADAGYPGFTDPVGPSDQFQLKITELDPDFDRNSDEGREWRELEIETALADFKCKTEVDYEQTLLRVQFELEEQFLKDNQALLDEIREEVRQHVEKEKK